MKKIVCLVNKVTTSNIGIENFSYLRDKGYTKIVHSTSQDKTCIENVLKENNYVIDEVYGGNNKLFNNFCILHKIKPNIVHAHQSQSFFYALFAKLFFSSKIIITLHANYEHYGFLTKIILLIAMLFSDSILANSSETAFSFPNFFKIKVIYNGVDTKNISYQLNKNNNINVILINRFIEGKRIDKVLLALLNSRLYEKIENVFVIGNGPLYEKINNNFQYDKISFLGELNREEVYSYLNLSDIFIIGSVSEGFCNAAMEAAMSGCSIFLPNLEVFQELYPNLKLFKDFDELRNQLDNYQPHLNTVDMKWLVQFELSTSANLYKSEYDLL